MLRNPTGTREIWGWNMGAFHWSGTGRALVGHWSGTGRAWVVPLVGHWSGTGRALVGHFPLVGHWSGTGRALVGHWSPRKASKSTRDPQESRDFQKRVDRSLVCFLRGRLPPRQSSNQLSHCAAQRSPPKDMLRPLNKAVSSQLSVLSPFFLTLERRGWDDKAKLAWLCKYMFHHAPTKTFENIRAGKVGPSSLPPSCESPMNLLLTLPCRRVGQIIVVVPQTQMQKFLKLASVESW